MNASELIKEWPCWCKANAETVFGSPAWRVVTEYSDDTAMVVRRKDFEPLVALDVMLEDDRNRLVIGESGEFCDLMRLKGRLEGLPSEVVVALVEKECGALLQTIENVVKRQLRIVGVATIALDDLESFAVVRSGDEIGFAIRTDQAMIQTFGSLVNLDPGHEAIRSMEREAVAEYAEVNLLEGEVDSLRVGDRLLIPSDSAKAWRVDSAADDLIHVRAAKPVPIRFSSFADDDMPEVPDPSEIVLVRRGKVIASAVIENLGLSAAARIVSVN